MSIGVVARGRSAAPSSRVLRSLTFAAVSAWAVALSLPASAAPFNWEGFTWTADRAETGGNSIGTYFGRDNALLLNILPQTTSPGTESFYQYEGYKVQTGILPGSAFASADLYIPKSWEMGGFKDVALWINLTQPPESGLSYPTIGFYKDSLTAPAQIAFWDFDHNAFVAMPINYDAWTNFRINYLPGTTIGGGTFELLVNGQIVATMVGGDFGGNVGDSGHPLPIRRSIRASRR